jgi:hypothetical protein
MQGLIKRIGSLFGDSQDGNSAEVEQNARERTESGEKLHQCTDCGEVYLSDGPRECSDCNVMTTHVGSSEQP